ncbi:hypothetical protein DFJ74DRAFT_705875 [Hyaloraphidium curvatum]|nr:hypothetical protein DFJ74DRAFT_705875 [Hyaloraphidium curvatum]
MSALRPATAVQRRGNAPAAALGSPDADEGPDHRPLAGITTDARPSRIPGPVRPRPKSAKQAAADAELQRMLEQGCLMLFIVTIVIAGSIGFAMWKNQRLVLEKLVREEEDLKRQLLLADPKADIEGMVAEEPPQVPYRPEMQPPGGGSYGGKWYGNLPPNRVRALKIRDIRKKLDAERSKYAAEHGWDAAVAKEKEWRDAWLAEAKAREGAYVPGQRPIGGGAYATAKKQADKAADAKPSQQEAEVQRLKEEMEKLKEELAKLKQATEGG